MLIGPVFNREVTTTPRNWRLYFSRAVYVAALFGLVLTVWLILIGSQQVRGLGDLSRFGSAVFALLAPLQLAMAIAFSALLTAAAVAQEKDRRTFDLLLMTNLSNVELVLGKLLASMLNVLVLIVAATSLLMLITLLGGVSYGQVARVVGVTLTAAVVAGSLGSTIALWREKTFQSLAMTSLLLVLWLLSGEILASGVFGELWLGVSLEQWAVVLTPFRAILAAIRPWETAENSLATYGGAVTLFLVVSSAFAVLLNLWAICRVRVWNPLQEKREPRKSSDFAGNLQPTEVSARSTQPAKSRRVWDNPILWREIMTWAYGKKIVVIRLVYLVVFAICALALVAYLGEADSRLSRSATQLAAAKPVVPLMLLGLVLVNALAVTSITNERDLRALDLLLVTDLTPKEIVLGKLGGVFYNSKEMILLPILLCTVLWYSDHLSTENLVFLIVTLLVMNLFVAMLGVHSGMAYLESRTAVAVSLSTVLFLLLGIAVCMRMMLAFQSSFTYQFQAFAAFMLGGGAGLFMALGSRNPSNAIGVVSMATPFATFYVITSYLQGSFGAAFLVAVATYGFATAALLIPALDEFDVATGRSSGDNE